MMNSNNIRFVFLFLFSIISTSVLYIIGLQGVGYNTFGFMISNVGRFDDFYNIFKFTPILPLNEMQYTPFIIFIGRFLSNNNLPYTFICLSIFLVLPLILFFRNNIILEKNCLIFLIIIFLSSHAFLFAFFRGNPVLSSFLFVIVAFAYSNHNNHVLCFVSLLLASLIHPIALLYSILFFTRKYIKFFLIFLIIFLISNLYFYLLISTNSLITDIILHFSSLHKYKLSYIFGTAGDLFNNSLFLILKIIFKNKHLDVILNAMFICNIIVIFLCFYDRFKNNSSSFLIILPVSTILFSPVSADYRLLYLFLPIISLLNKKNFLMIFYLIIIILPKNFFWFISLSTWGITVNSFINPILLLFLLIYLLYIRFFTNRIIP